MIQFGLRILLTDTEEHVPPMCSTKILYCNLGASIAQQVRLVLDRFNSQPALKAVYLSFWLFDSGDLVALIFLLFLLLWPVYDCKRKAWIQGCVMYLEYKLQASVYLGCMIVLSKFSKDVSRAQTNVLQLAEVLQPILVTLQNSVFIPAVICCNLK